jgi:hypothetical protein
MSGRRKNNLTASSPSAAASSQQTQLLKILEDMLHNRIAKKKVDMHNSTEIAETEKIRTEIETLLFIRYTRKMCVSWPIRSNG